MRWKYLLDINKINKKKYNSVALSIVYLPERVQTSSLHSMRMLAKLKGKSREAVIHLGEVINSIKWIKCMINFKGHRERLTFDIEHALKRNKLNMMKFVALVLSYF